ncbi:DNA polymerase IV [Bacillus thermotolerans]|uniref:DNA polymerase IV n=1 Tax=Bacillus thermotolerans TaxID=1221996 RepID=UPI0006171509|nr:DNA polymerase IV [Bacillus thermotolerans]KKB36221.1 DNA polymerase IV [Bacillus thermotolerans]
MKRFYPRNGRVILHVDMNSFYASVEIAHNPSLKGLPLAIAGQPEERKGIIVTCSYEARAFGIKTTMPVWQAKRLCPHLVILPPDFNKYRQASAYMFQLLREYTPLVEPVSIDEGYMDITESYSLGKPIDIARKIQDRLLQELKLPSSIGIAPNKFLAKMASNMQKPLGLTVLRKREVPSVLWPKPVIEMHGIGRKTADKLALMGISTIGDLAAIDNYSIRQQLGIRGVRLKEYANGEDRRKVDPKAAEEFKSVGQSMTLPKDETKQQELLKVLQQLADRTAARLKRKGVLGSTVTLTIRYKDWHTITRTKRLTKPVEQAAHIWAAAKALLLTHWNGNGVRLLGITVQDIVEREQADIQLDLFSYEEEAKKGALNELIDGIRQKHGEDIIHKGVHSHQKGRPKKGKRPDGQLE